jgi:hypothetical protein
MKSDHFMCDSCLAKISSALARAGVSSPVRYVADVPGLFVTCCFCDEVTRGEIVISADSRYMPCEGACLGSYAPAGWVGKQ